MNRKPLPLVAVALAAASLVAACGGTSGPLGTVPPPSSSPEPSVAQGSPDAICDNLLAEPVRAQFAEAAGQPDCDGAVHALAAQVTDTGRYADAEAPSSQAGDGLSVDACALDWGAKPAGPQLGHLTITAVARSRYLVTGFRPCRP